MLTGCEPDGTRGLGKVPDRLLANSDATIADGEALLIQTLRTYRTGNRQQMRFAAAKRWEQIRRDERDRYLTRIAS